MSSSSARFKLPRRLPRRLASSLSRASSRSYASSSVSRAPVRLVVLAREISQAWPLRSRVSVLMKAPACSSQSLSSPLLMLLLFWWSRALWWPRWPPRRRGAAGAKASSPCRWEADLLLGRRAPPWADKERRRGELVRVRAGDRESSLGVAGADLP